MPQFSAGLAVGPPALSELVFPPSFPFVRNFYVSNAVWYSVLDLDVWTSYDTSTAVADVRINGHSVDQIPPRSYVQNGFELAPVAVLFHNWVLLGTGPFGKTGFNELQIVPPTPSDYLIVRNWRIHFNQLLQP